jgi:membrane fusion protein, copper/silver efflux system
MKVSNKLVLTATLATLFGAALGVGVMALRPSSAPTPAPEPGRKILYWYDPMVPQSRFDKPGRSPFMDMDLVPKYADETAQAGGVRIDPRVTQNMGVRLAVVEKGRLDSGVEAVGTLQPADDRVVVVQSRVGGYVESQAVRRLYQPVRRGEVLLTLTSPELIAAQEEYLLALKARDEPLAAAARERLSLLGMGQGQVAAVARRGAAVRRVPVVAPADGIVTELPVRLGQTVMAGAPLATLTDLGRLWVIADVPERHSAGVSAGRRAEVRFAALPDRAVRGTVDYVYPELAGNTRTLRARVPVPNPEGSLRPGMLARVSFDAGESGERLLIPSEAVIETGRRSVVIVAAEPGRFDVAEVKTGAEAGGKTEILSGLEVGRQVVASGQFLIDSEASLNAAVQRLQAAPSAQPEHAAQLAASDHAGHGADHGQTAKAAAEGAKSVHQASGRIEAIDRAAGKLEIAHGPVPSLSMPPMTMNFPVEKAELLRGLAVGQEVDFEFRVEGSKWIITRIAPRR